MFKFEPSYLLGDNQRRPNGHVDESWSKFRVCRSVNMFVHYLQFNAHRGRNFEGSKCGQQDRPFCDQEYEQPINVVELLLIVTNVGLRFVSRRSYNFRAHHIDQEGGIGSVVLHIGYAPPRQWPAFLGVSFQVVRSALDLGKTKNARFGKHPTDILSA